MTLEIILQASGALLTVIISVYQIRNNIPRSRIKLKQDLEILKLLSPDSENYRLIKENVDKDISTIYAIKTRKGFFDLISYRTIDLVLGSLFFLGGSAWTFYLITQTEPSLWMIVSVLMVVGGLGQIYAALGNQWPRKVT